jgi:N-methylhydantoinase A
VLTKDIAMDLSRSRLMSDDGDGFISMVRQIFDDLKRRAEGELQNSGASVVDLQFAHTIDVRYVGQNFELPVPIDIDDPALREQIRARFHEEHRKVYGFERETSTLQLVTFRLRVVSPTARPRAMNGSTTRQHGSSSGRRPVIFEDPDCPVSCDLYERGSLAAGQRINGPAVIEQMDTTTIVPPGFSALAHQSGNLFLYRDEMLPA